MVSPAVNRLSKADGSAQCSAKTFVITSSGRLCKATATSPVRLHEHEVPRRHRVAVPFQSAEDCPAERKSGFFDFTIPEIFARICRVCEQCDVAVRGCVAVFERDWAVIYLPKIHTTVYTTTEIQSLASTPPGMPGTHTSPPIFWLRGVNGNIPTNCYVLSDVADRY